MEQKKHGQDGLLHHHFFCLKDGIGVGDVYDQIAKVHESIGTFGKSEHMPGKRPKKMLSKSN